LIELSIEKKILDRVMEDMEMISSLCVRNRQFMLFLKNPIIKNYKKLSVLKKIFEKKVNELTYRFIDIITRKSREDVLPEIANEFLVQYRQYRKIEIVEVTTPIKLDEALQSEFEKLAKNYIGKDWTVRLVEKVNKELIGGYIVKIGDRQIDDSVLSKLRDVKKQLMVS
jgi:F-type H+-transporting ATPase subunit delta